MVAEGGAEEVGFVEEARLALGVELAVALHEPALGGRERIGGLSCTW